MLLLKLFLFIICCNYHCCDRGNSLFAFLSDKGVLHKITQVINKLIGKSFKLQCRMNNRFLVPVPITTLVPGYIIFNYSLFFCRRRPRSQSGKESTSTWMEGGLTMGLTWTLLEMSCPWALSTGLATTRMAGLKDALVEVTQYWLSSTPTATRTIIILKLFVPCSTFHKKVGLHLQYFTGK